MTSKKTLFLGVVASLTLLALIIGATYAYFQASGGTGTNTDVNVTTYTTDVFNFEVGSDISIYADATSFAKDKGNASGSTFAKAILTANNKTNTSTMNYYLYLNILNNSFGYTINENRPELLLTITDSSGNPVTDITSLTYKTVTDGKGASISGYDITNQDGLITLFDKKAITATPTKTDQWNITVTFINYNADQSNNMGKEFNAKLMIQKDEFVPPDINVKVSNKPTTYGKLGSINCTNSSATYNQKYNRIEISSIDKKYTSCTLNYTDSTSKVNLADYIIGLAGTTQGTGKVLNENGYRYEGKNPNNYIWFNNEYWRIIGVFDSASHGQDGKNLVKIIRAEPLDWLAWDKSNKNDWKVASLNSLLNGAYYNAQDGTSSGYCYECSIITATCDYTESGIQSGYRGMVANVTWYLGGHSGLSASAESLYGYERGTKVYSGRPTSTTGYIGLMYPSDYGYSVLSSSCERTTNLVSYNSDKCAGQSWLYGKGNVWTLTPLSSYNNYVFILDINGHLDGSVAHEGYGSRPVLYLDASVYKIDGDGSLENPYIVGM